MKSSIENMDTIWVVEWGTKRRFYTVYENALKQYKDNQRLKYTSVKMFEIELGSTMVVRQNKPQDPPPKQPGPVHIQANTFNIFDIVGDPNENNP